MFFSQWLRRWHLVLPSAVNHQDYQHLSSPIPSTAWREMDCRAVFVRKRREEKKKIPILSSTRLPAYLLVYYQLNQRPWLSHNAPVIRNEKKTAFWSWWIVCCSLAPSSSWGWAGAATGVVWLSWLPVPCLIFRSKKKREREREWREHEHKLPVFLCRPSLFSLSLLFFIFFAVGCGFSRPGVDEKCVNPITSSWSLESNWKRSSDTRKSRRRGSGSEMKNWGKPHQSFFGCYCQHIFIIIYTWAPFISASISHDNREECFHS